MVAWADEVAHRGALVHLFSLARLSRSEAAMREAYSATVPAESQGEMR